MAAVPGTPKTWSVGEVLTAANLNAELRDSLSFLANPPSCRVYNNANIPVNNDTDTLVTFNSERYDTAAMHSTASNTSRITIPTAGLYLLTFTGIWVDSNDYVVFGAYFRRNGGAGALAATALTANSNSWLYKPWFHLSTIYKLAAGDYVETVVYQRNNAGAARNLLVAADYSPEFAATWIGNG